MSKSILSARATPMLLISSPRVAFDSYNRKYREYRQPYNERDLSILLPRALDAREALDESSPSIPQEISVGAGRKPLVSIPSTAIATLAESCDSYR